MKWLNIETRVLHSPQYIGSEPTARATWLNLMLWCADQENAGLITGARTWSCRRWQQTCGVTADEVKAAAPLLTFEGDDMAVLFYPLAQQATMQAKRKIAQTNGQLGGRPRTKKPTAKPTLVSTSEPTSESGKERKEKKGNIAPNGARDAKPKPSRERNPLLDALAGLDGSDPAQVTGKAWGGIATALKEIREVCPNVSPEEIRRRAGNYRQHMTHAMLTAPALAKHWATCDHPPQAATATPQLKHKPF